jgi:uncharacterized cupin superfamily protein
MSQEDLQQFEALGGAALIAITNRDHERQAAFFKERTKAQVVAHREDADSLEVAVDCRLEHGEEIVGGMRAIHLRYGKSPGEIALYWPDRKLVLFGDLVVGAPLGKFTLLMDEKLADPPRAALELRKLLALEFDAVLVGDGHSILHHARERLVQCLEERRDIYLNKINADEMEWEPGLERQGYTWEEKDIDPLIGARRLGYQLIRLPSGQSTFPMHFHHFGEELFYVMEGQCTLLTTRGQSQVRQGDFIAFPPGPAGAHKFTNQGPRPCVLLALGERLPHDVGEYPDSEKINVFAKRDTGQRLFRLQDAVGYWEGE